MRFRAIAAGDLRALDALIVPVSADGAGPALLTRPLRVVAERVAKSAALRLYGVSIQQGLAGPARLVVVGAGRRDELTPERIANIASTGVRALARSGAKRIGIVVDHPEAIGADAAVSAIVEGAVAGTWRGDVHRTRREVVSPNQVGLLGAAVSPRAIRRGEAIGDAVNFTRRLANEPGNLLTPTGVADEAKALAAARGLTCEILSERRCRALGMGSFLSVAQGSTEPPQLIVLRHAGRPGGGVDLALVGKGITFDTGGISIKPAGEMHKMKGDMTGAAAVVGVMGAIARLRLPLNVVAVAPCTENMPGPRATKPGDVFTSMSGKTVEVINTDAEGRLVLLDALTYAQRLGARRVVDIATLTGAMRVALGDHFSGLFGRPDRFLERVRVIGERAGDHFWTMPLTDEFREEVRSEIADLRNQAGRYGGSSKAAAFLDAVVDEGVEWAHLDIASQDWSDRERPHTAKGPQAPGVRTLIALAEATAMELAASR